MRNHVLKLKALWDSLDPTRRIVAALAAVALVAALVGVARLSMAPQMALLYAGLEGPAAGQVLAALDQRGIRYEVRGNAIYVDAAVRDVTRMAFAAEGLPPPTTTGYELLDGLSGFSTTAQMFDAAYWRAKEGELARTILSSPQVRAARVHIAHDGTQTFRRDRRMSASVTITPAQGGITPQFAEALKHLVASAVAGLSPQDVAVIDATTGLLQADPLGPGAGGERAAELKRNVERLLEARVGPGRAVVEVHVETATESETIVERRIDPDSRVALATESEERSSSSTDTRNPAVGVASNLPDGEAQAGQGRAEARDQVARARTTFEVSQMSREVRRSPGGIKRITVAVLVDGRYETGPDGTRTFVPRPEEELVALRELVAAAVGFDPERGDRITLHSLPFEAAAEAGTAAQASWIDRLGIDLGALVRLASLAFVVLVLALVLLRILLRSSARVEPKDGTGVTPSPLLAPPSLEATPAERPDARTPEVLSAEIAGMPRAALPTATSHGADSLPEDPVARMRATISARQAEALEILRGWLSEAKEPTKARPERSAAVSDGGR